jgi:hypothetical protein
MADVIEQSWNRVNYPTRPRHAEETIERFKCPGYPHGVTVRYQRHGSDTYTGIYICGTEKYEWCESQEDLYVGTKVYGRSTTAHCSLILFKIRSEALLFGSRLIPPIVDLDRCLVALFKSCCILWDMYS